MSAPVQKTFGFRLGNGDFQPIRTAEDDDHAERLEAALRETNPRAERVNAVELEVFEIDNAVYKKRTERAEGAKPLRVGQCFTTAAEASRHMGYIHNEVGIKWAQQNRDKSERAKKVTVCGVSFRTIRD